MSDDRATRLRPWMLVALAALLAIIAFLPSLSGDWIYDDRPLIAQNPHIQTFGDWSRWLTHDFWDVSEEMVSYGHRMVYWRPLITASYALEWKLGGGDPLLFHVMNFAWQALVGALAFIALRRWTGAAVPALVCAVLFAIHPTKAESVAWIAGRTDVLCMAFVFVAGEGMARRLRGRRGGLALEVAGTVLAYMTKEQAIVLPVFAAVEAWVYAGRPPLERRAILAMLRAALPQAVLAGAYLAVRAFAMPIAAANMPDVHLHASTHTMLVLETYGRFTELVAFPHDLSIQQGLIHGLGAANVSWPHIALGAITLVGGGALCWWCRKRWPVVTVGLGFYLITLAPTSNLRFTQMQTLVSERFLYLPSLGLALVVGVALANASAAWRRRGYALAVAAALAYAALSMSRSTDFRDEEIFWNRELELHPDSELAHDYLVRFAVLKREFRTALAMLLEPIGDRPTQDAFSAVRHAFFAAKVAAQSMPDADTDGLRRIDAFAAAVLARAPKPTLALPGGTLALDTSSTRFPEALRDVREELIALRASIHTRIDDDPGALALADEAMHGCKTCLVVIPITAVAYAAAGRYDRAHQVLRDAHGSIPEDAFAHIDARITAAEEVHAQARGLDPASLRARTTELTELELWGRAFGTLEPYLADIAKAPRVATSTAEVAFRAGHPDIARRLLVDADPFADVDGKFARWSASMGWQ